MPCPVTHGKVPFHVLALKAPAQPFYASCMTVHCPRKLIPVLLRNLCGFCCSLNQAGSLKMCVTGTPQIPGSLATLRFLGMLYSWPRSGSWTCSILSHPKVRSGQVFFLTNLPVSYSSCLCCELDTVRESHLPDSLAEGLSGYPTDIPVLLIDTCLRQSGMPDTG